MSHPIRRSPRLQGYDYGSNTSYFVTICLAERSPLFGQIDDRARLIQSVIGNMVAITWISITDRYISVTLDDFIVMPDHLHGLLTLEPVLDASANTTLSDVIGWFKGMTTHLYGQGVQNKGWPRYSGKLWQSRFHDHIVRDERDFDARVKYIESNPWRWVENRKS